MIISTKIQLNFVYRTYSKVVDDERQTDAKLWEIGNHTARNATAAKEKQKTWKAAIILVLEKLL